MIDIQHIYLVAAMLAAYGLKATKRCGPKARASGPAMSRFALQSRHGVFASARGSVGCCVVLPVPIAQARWLGNLPFACAGKDQKAPRHLGQGPDLPGPHARILSGEAECCSATEYVEPTSTTPNRARLQGNLLANFGRCPRCLDDSSRKPSGGSPRLDAE